MLTVGIDLASSPERTAVCRVRWQTEEAAVDSIECQADDDVIQTAIFESDKSGIDVPLGWPSAFVSAVSAHHAGGTWPGADDRNVRLRATDRYVASRPEHSRAPLSVSADRIAIPAFRAARLLTALRRKGLTVDRSGRGRIVEVYPAAALSLWGFLGKGYKGAKGTLRRRALVGQLAQRCGRWLNLGQTKVQCEGDDNALDALIAALVARASALDLCLPIPAEHAGEAAAEGWIALPRSDSLERLVTPDRTRSTTNGGSEPSAIE